MANIQPTITINGTSSSTIAGLIICELPPITKPPMRALADEIDGRDGDSITKLGYKAYDKPAKIGLAGSFDVDAVISFFNQDGIITFSNEATKYYRFSQLEGIDFEKLLRFKTADVVFHVQPFKFSTTESERTFTFTAGSSSGELEITNQGNYIALPVIELTGSGNAILSINEEELFTIDFGETESVIILDAEKMNAYDENGNLKNRSIMGNMEKFHLEIGLNEISFTGSISQIKIQNYSRWL